MEKLTAELWRAMLRGEYDLVNQLICSGANVNDRENKDVESGMTLLHFATRQLNVKIIRLLINHGANIDARDKWMRTPLHLAVQTDDCPEVVQELINGGADVNARIPNDNLCYQDTPLHTAVVEGFHQSAEVLIASGASIEEDVSHGWNTLHLAINYDNFKMVKLLISRGMNVEAETRWGETPLHCALLNECSTEMIEYLLDNGANIYKKQEGESPIYIAGTSNALASLRLLIKRGARIDEVDELGNTALHMACMMESNKVAGILVKFGADMNVRNHDGETALELLPKVPFSEAETARAIIREAVRRETVDQHICEGYRKMVQSCEKYSKFDRKCRKEIQRMRRETIDVEDHAVTFFYIFSKNQKKIAALARNEKIVTAFEASDYRESFRIYGVDLTTKMEKAKQRANFLIGNEDHLVDVLSDLLLPAPIVQKIATYVD